MVNEAMKVRRMLCAVRSQLRTDLKQMAEEVLERSFGAGSEVGQTSADVRDLDVERLRTDLALRTMASQYALLSRIDKALEPAGEAPCVSPECAVARSAASHDAVAV